MIFVAIFVVLIGLRFFAFANGWSVQKVYLFVLGFLFLFSAFRFEVGPDWTGYLNVYRIQRWSTLSEAIRQRNPGYWTINEFVHSLQLSYPWVNLFSSGVFFWGLHQFAKRQTDPLGFLVMAFPVLIVNMPMSSVKQAMGIGLVCVAFVAYLDKRMLRFVFWVLGASLFHGSALIFLLLVPLVKAELKQKQLVQAGVLAIPGLISLALSSEAETMQSRYIERSVDAAGAIFRVGVLVATGIFFHFYVRNEWKRLYPEDYRLAGLGALMMMAIAPLIFVSTVIADRFGYYLIPLQLMIYCRFPHVLATSRYSRLLVGAPYAGLLILFLGWTQFSTHFEIGYLPYQTWLFGFPQSTYYIAH